MFLGVLISMMHLMILGSGTGIPLSHRASPSLVLTTGRGPILFDMGPGSLRQLARVGIGHHRVSLIFITHFHPDHTADLIHFLFATKNPRVLEQREPFTIVGPRGLAAFIYRIRKAYATWLDVPSDLLRIEELDIQKPGRVSCLGLEFQSQPLRHTDQCLAYRVWGPSGESFVYSGDTGYCREMIDLSRGCDLLILEASLPEGEGVEGHLTPYQAGQIAAIANVPRLVLTHFYPEVLRTNIARECRRAYGGELILGQDLLHLSLRVKNH